MFNRIKQAAAIAFLGAATALAASAQAPAQPDASRDGAKRPAARKAPPRASEANPIRVGAISTLSGGPAGFAPSALATQAFFDSINATGGVQGRKLVLIQADDKGDPKQAREAALRLVQDERVVANVGSASLLECAVNAPLYKEAGMVSIPGLGLDGMCFNSPMIAPVNAGPYAQLRLAMRFATERLGAQRLCVLRLGNPVNVQKGFDDVVAAWSAETGRKLHIDDRNLQYEDNMVDALRRATDGGCQAIVFGGPTPFVLATAKAARQVGTKMPLLYLGAAYTEQVAHALGAEGDGIYAMSEFEPWSSRSGSLSNWRNLMNTGKVPVTSSSQGGYVAAQVFVQVLRTIKGEINRESVAAAFRAMPPIHAPMLGMPFVFGEAQQHHPNQAAIPVRLEQGSWRIAHHDWIRTR